MPSFATPMEISTNVQLRIIGLVKECCYIMNSAYSLRERLMEVDRMYMREVDETLEQWKAKRANKRGDPTKFQNIVIPVVLPQVENAVTYQSSVFLTGYPIFGVVSNPANADAALQMDTIIGEQQVRGGWVNEFQKTFRTGFKHNLMGQEVDWVREISYNIGTAPGSTEAELTETIWAGNRCRNLDLYNVVIDTRVKPTDIAKWGEFSGYHEIMSRGRLKKFLLSLPQSFNHDKIDKTPYWAPSTFSSMGSEHYFMPSLNPGALVDPASLSLTTWTSFLLPSERNPDYLNHRFSGMYLVTHMYIRFCPADIGIKKVPGPTIPQVWKFIVINHQVVVYAERLSNAHDLIPTLYSQPYDDDLGYQTKSLAANVGPIQEISTALANSSIASRRRALADRMLYDPTRVNKKDINSDSPTAKIAVRPSAFDTDLSRAIYPIPFQDNQFQINSMEMQNYLQFANVISGMNPARQGQFVKGNKTRAEFQDIMGYANGRDQAVAISIENTLMIPVKEIIKTNILQYQGPESVFNREQQIEVRVDPLSLRKALLSFKISDGLTPNEKLIDGESLTLAFQTIQAVPQLQAAYNLGPMFSYLLKSRGARLAEFEKPQEQLAYEQALQAWSVSVQQVAAQIDSNANLGPEQIQQLLQSLPPQPTPQQFGWDPNNVGQPDTRGIPIVQQVTENNGGAGASA